MTGSKTQRVIGWILSGLLALMLIAASASGKFTEWEGKEAMFEKMGFTTDLMFKIGIVEVIVTMLFLTTSAISHTLTTESVKTAKWRRLPLKRSGIIFRAEVRFIG